MKSFTICLGTAIKWVSRYSESLITRDGSTIAVRDLFERLPLEEEISDCGIMGGCRGSTFAFFATLKERS